MALFTTKLKASGDLAKLKDGAKIVLMGTADAVASVRKCYFIVHSLCFYTQLQCLIYASCCMFCDQGPKEKVLFVEDMTTEQKTEMTGAAGGGLVNLGNTCYMNSTLQCLRAVKPLKDALLRFQFAAACHFHNACSIALLFFSVDRSINRAPVATCACC